MLFIFQELVQEKHNFCGSGSSSCFFNGSGSKGPKTCGSGSPAPLTPTKMNLNVCYKEVEWIHHIV